MKRLTQFFTACLSVQLATTVVMLIVAIASLTSQGAEWFPFREYIWWSRTYYFSAAVFAIWVYMATRLLQRQSPTPLLLKPLCAALLVVVPIIFMAFYPLNQLATLSSKRRIPGDGFGKTYVPVVNVWMYSTFVGSCLIAIAVIGHRTQDASLKVQDNTTMVRALWMLTAGCTFWIAAGVALYRLVRLIEANLSNKGPSPP